MVYPPLNLGTMTVLVGLLMVALHALALVRPRLVQNWLRDFPRSYKAGVALLTAASLWAFILTAKMDLGEFTKFRTTFLIAIAIAYVLSLSFVQEFLAVRALGMLLLLLAEPVLEAAFLRPQSARLLLVVLAYVWILAGMFWIGMPYLLRDQIAWLGSRE